MILKSIFSRMIMLQILALFGFAFSYAQEIESNVEQLPLLTVTAPREPIENYLFPDHPAQELPFSASAVPQTDLRKNQIKRLADVTRAEASTSDSYNSVGYWDYLSVRGFLLDNRGSYLREGLPINAETSIPLDNKSRVEILKGLTGMQVGASSPGGMVNYVVQRPKATPAKEIYSSLSSKGDFLLSGNADGRFHFAYEELRPTIEHSNGQRYVVALAHDWRLGENSVLEFEIENSRRSQPSQVGLSLLGGALPSVQNPNLNLNDQSWVRPVVFSALTGTLKFTQSLTSQWKWSAVVGLQDLLTDDRLAYAYGCSAENNYDRYCSDGTFDVYDFRSDGEHRRLEAAKISTQVTLSAGSVTQKLNIGVMQSQSRERFERQAYNYVGVGSVSGGVVLPEDPSLTDESTNRDARTTDLFVSDVIEYQSWTLWLGARRSDMDRYSVRTDGSRAVGFREDFVVPWAALSYKFTNLMTYFSYGEGIETYVTPNRAGYANPGTFLPVARSRQYEAGIKGEGAVSWAIAAFEIHRPAITDLAPAYQIDGDAKHRGLELQAQRNQGAWDMGLSLMLLEARREGSALTPAVNSLRPVNVPKNTLRAFTEYRLDPKLSIRGMVSREDDRAVTADNSILLPSWTRWDLGIQYQPIIGKTSLRLAIENIADEKYWRESPTQYSHIYLYPGSERNFTLSAEHWF